MLLLLRDSPIVAGVNPLAPVNFISKGAALARAVSSATARLMVTLASESNFFSTVFDFVVVDDLEVDVVFGDAWQHWLTQVSGMLCSRSMFSLTHLA